MSQNRKHDLPTTIGRNYGAGENTEHLLSAQASTGHAWASQRWLLHHAHQRMYRLHLPKTLPGDDHGADKYAEGGQHPLTERAHHEQSSLEAARHAAAVGRWNRLCESTTPQEELRMKLVKRDTVWIERGLPPFPAVLPNRPLARLFVSTNAVALLLGDIPVRRRHKHRCDLRDSLANQIAAYADTCDQVDFTSGVSSGYRTSSDLRTSYLGRRRVWGERCICQQSRLNGKRRRCHHQP